MNLSSEINETRTNANNSQLAEEGDSSAIGCVFLVISVLVMSTNGVVVFVIVKMRELHLPTLWLIIHMAVWDFLLGFHYLIFIVPSGFLNRFAYSDKLLAVAACSKAFIVSENLCSVALMMIDRCIAVKRPFDYSRIATRTNIGATILASFLYSLGRVLITVLPADKFLYIKKLAAISISYATIGEAAGAGVPIVITFAVIIICLVMLFADIRRGNQTSEASRATSLPKNAKFSVMAVVSAGIFCISYAPALLSVVRMFARGKESISTHFSVFVLVSFLCNSIWNVFIYTATYLPFREALISTFNKSYYRRKKQAEIKATFMKQTSC